MPRVTLAKKPIHRIIIVGNGFDIAHNYDLSFKSFIINLVNKIVDNFQLTRKADNAFLSIKDRISGNRLDFTSNFGADSPFRRVSELKERQNYFIVNDSELYIKIRDQLNTLGWVDLEQIYFDLLAEFVKSSKYKIKPLNDQMRFLQEELRIYLKDECKIENKKVKPEIVQQLTTEISSEAEIIKDGQKFGKWPEKYLFLNFNYTELLLKYCEQIPRRAWEHISIHGVLDGNDGDFGQKIIFGYGDERNEEFQSFEKNRAPKEAYQLIKSYKYLESRSYQQVIRFINSNPYQVSIFGHSCGQSDRTLLRTIFNHPNCLSIKPYYYKEQNGNDDYFDKSVAISMAFNDNEKFREILVNKIDCEPMIQAPEFNNKD